MNQPKSALSAKMHTDGPMPEIKALAATEEPLDVMMRRIIAEFKGKPTELKRSYSQQERDAYKRGRQDAQGDRYQQQGSRQDARSDRLPHQDRHSTLPPNPARGQVLPPQRPPQSTMLAQPNQGQFKGRGNGRRPSGNFHKYGAPGASRQRVHERKMFGATEEAYVDEEDHQDISDPRAFSASAQSDHDDWDYGEGEDRHAMMGRRDYDFDDLDYDDEGPA